MSSNSYTTTCPKCSKESLNCCVNNRPFDCISGECLECGFYYFTQEGQTDLKEVNEIRKDNEQKPLKKLAKQW